MSLQGIPRPKHMWYIVMRAAIKGTQGIRTRCVMHEAATSAKAVTELYTVFDCIHVESVTLEPRNGVTYTRLEHYQKAIESMTVPYNGIAAEGRRDIRGRNYA